MSTKAQPTFEGRKEETTTPNATVAPVETPSTEPVLQPAEQKSDIPSDGSPAETTEKA